MRKKILIGTGVSLALLLALLLAALGYALHAYRALNVEGQYFDSNGVRIHYSVAGKGTPVILVHGLAGNIGVEWVRPEILPKLAAQYQVVALDLRGHGRSGKPHDPNQYGLEVVEDIVRLMDHLEIRKAHLVGYSLGGFIVLKFAILHPDRLLSVAPCGSGWAGKPETDLAFLRELADSVDKGEGFGPLLDRLQPVGRPVSKGRRMFVSALISATNDIKALGALLRSVDALRVTEAELRNNKVPALAIIGERDPLKTFADQLAAVMANVEEAVVPDGNHFSTLGRPKFIESLEGFLDKNTPEPAKARAARREEGVKSGKGEKGILDFGLRNVERDGAKRVGIC